MVSKTHQAIHFARSQKRQHKYIVSKILSALETFPYNYRLGREVELRMSWVDKNRKINKRGGRLLGTQEYVLFTNLRSKWLSRFHESWESSPHIRLIYN